MPNANVLIVDDIEANRDLLQQRIRKLGLTPHQAENGVQALEFVKKRPPDLILLDIMMPEMDGFEVLKRLKEDPTTRHLPVIVISALDEMEAVVRCIEGGAEDFLHKPFDKTLLRARVEASLERKFLRDQEAASAQLMTIFALSKLAESRDPETGEHLERMREYCKILASHLATTARYQAIIDEEYVSNIYGASPLHDVGKVGVPDDILKKPGKLTDEEFGVMKTHTTLGAATLRAVEERHPGNAFVRLGIEIADSHHEKWDGSGYPNGMAEEKIPLPGRILALGDVYDALTSRRCYKEAMPHSQARDIIVQGRGRHFDPDMVDAFLATEEAFVDVRRRYQDTAKVA
jgi:putative two-component system response regulator